VDFEPWWWAHAVLGHSGLRPDEVELCQFAVIQLVHSNISAYAHSAYGRASVNLLS
jgi:hypothetical protein